MNGKGKEEEEEEKEQEEDKEEEGQRDREKEIEKVEKDDNKSWVVETNREKKRLKKGDWK